MPNDPRILICANHSERRRWLKEFTDEEVFFPQDYRKVEGSRFSVAYVTDAAAGMPDFHRMLYVLKTVRALGRHVHIRTIPKGEHLT